MPRGNIEITLSENDPYWSGALYLALLAYPDPLEKMERQRFQHALARWTLIKRMEMDEKWAQDLQLVRPVYFANPDALHDGALKRGQKRLNKRLLIAKTVVMPHLRKFDSGRVHKVDGFAPTFANLIALATAELGLKEGSVDTVAHREWGPMKCIAHAISAYYAWSHILWKMWGRKEGVDRQLALLMLPEYVEEVVEIAEHFRSQLSEIKEFKVREENTIRLVTRWL